MSATAALSAAAVADVVTPGDAGLAAHTAARAITTGALALAAGLLRLGFLASFISEPVLKGFIIGLALTIVVGQLPDLFGVEGGGGDFFEKLWDLLGRRGQTSWTTLAVGLASLALVLGLRRFAPAVPGSLVAVLGGIAAVAVLDLDGHGVEIVGQIDSGLPALGGAGGGRSRLPVLIFDTLPGLFIGIAVSLLLLLYRAWRPHVAVLGQVPGRPGHYGDLQRHPESERKPGIELLRVEGGLFFANADTVRDAVRAHAARQGTRAVVLDAETAPYIDVSAARMLVQLTGDLRRSGVELVIARDVGQVRDVLRRAEAGAALPRAYPTVQDAVAAVAGPESPGTG
jgi:anti-anti-sigma factor